MSSSCHHKTNDLKSLVMSSFVQNITFNGETLTKVHSKLLFISQSKFKVQLPMLAYVKRSTKFRQIFQIVLFSNCCQVNICCFFAKKRNFLMNLALRTLTSRSCQVLKSPAFPSIKPFVQVQSRQFPQLYYRALSTSSILKVSRFFSRSNKVKWFMIVNVIF